jgi:hypothetical protein
MSPVEVVQRQTEAYNARDLARFLAMYSESITVFRTPTGAPSIVGKAQLAAFYKAERFNLPALRAEILNRIVIGNKVIEHEQVFGIGDAMVEAVAVYEVKDGLIERVWFFLPE